MLSRPTLDYWRWLLKNVVDAFLADPVHIVLAVDVAVLCEFLEARTNVFHVGVEVDSDAFGLEPEPAGLDAPTAFQQL